MACGNSVMFFVGWLIGVVSFTIFYILFGSLFNMCIKNPVKNLFKYYLGNWVCFICYMSGLLLSMAICIIVAWYVCWDVGRALGNGVWYTQCTLNLMHGVYAIIFHCYMKKRQNMIGCGAKKCNSGKTDNVTVYEAEKKIPL